ncbi:bifunctional epoxide hydrolase 2 [Indicator indicator]|uniref:bifunctional epoxide hydrolase 2 n=1 Tax=Indicator indicator TaxID=1002788 RepID=UPI0023DF63D0|nr:bifunctional epoxide hydrolase 2 [Indicator indicator]
MARRAVLFDLGGVLFGPGLQHFLGSCEHDSALPRNFFRNVLIAGGSNSPYAKVMKGQITLSQLFLELEQGCQQHASAAGIALPPTFSVTRAFEEMAAKGTVNAPLLQAARVLRRNGFKTCVLTNNWVDDSSGRLFTATLMNLLHRHFDLVIESCRLGVQKPDPKIYSYALEVLQAKPQEVIFLDDIGENLKPAQEMGMATILVRDTRTVLKELEELSGVQLLTQEEPKPTVCDPAAVTHGYVPIRPGVQLHFVEMGHGPVVCLCHGFPESWLSWRYQVMKEMRRRPPSSSTSWLWDYAVGYYLLEFLLWISTFVPSLVCWINRCFFWLLFRSRVENVAISYKIFNYECRFKQHVQDWAIPIEKTKEALLELKAALENNPKLVAHYPVEVRFARGDEIWMSPCFQRDSCYMNIIMYRPYGKNVPHLNYWLTYEGIMKKHGGRPHWAKAHSCTQKDFEKMYPAFPKFCSIREKLDPTGMFLNSYLEKVFY